MREEDFKRVPVCLRKVVEISRADAGQHLSHDLGVVHSLLDRGRCLICSAVLNEAVAPHNHGPAGIMSHAWGSVR
jgi:hypothetical protein